MSELNTYFERCRVAFDKDASELTREDIDVIIARFRQDRASFNLGEKPATKNAKAKPGAEIKVDIDDLLA
jgi:hypothetical protein